jgi:Ca2+-binding RTX toxin-like protein
MASIKIYDAIGFGINVSNADIVYVKNGYSMSIDDNVVYIVERNGDTCTVKFTYNDKEFSSTAVVKELKYFTYQLESFDLLNANKHPLIEISNLNSKFSFDNSIGLDVFSKVLAGNDVIEGNKYNDIIKAEKGNDTLIGNGGNDLLDGGAGADTVLGGSGNDTLIGGGGKDKLIGGTGSDIFDFNALTDTGITSATRDVITDFTTGDKIDLSTLDANPATATNNAFTFIGASDFGSDATGQLRYVYNSASKIGVLYGSTDADSAAEFTIELTGATSLSAQSFIL